MQGLYLFSILPPSGIEARLNDIRHELSRKYNCKESLCRPVHLTLYPPIKMDVRFEQQLPLIGEWVKKQHVFELCIDGFGWFNNAIAPVVFAKPRPDQKLRSFQYGLQQMIHKALPVAGDYSFTPHITLAFKDLRPSYMPEIISDFSDRGYVSAFAVDKIDLLKHDGGRWQKFIQMPLGVDISSDTAQQAELFT